MSEQKQISSLSILGVLLALGLMAAAFILGVQFKNLRQPGTITVKGLAEKNFQSDSATWNTGVNAHGESYQEVLDLLTARRKKLSKFLGEQGFAAAEMKVGLPEVSRVFNETRDELGNVTRTPNGYDGDLNIVVNTKKLDKIQAAQRAILNFRAQNEFIRFDNPQYLLGNLETIKRDLITQATEDAQKRAAEFAKPAAAKWAPCVLLRKVRSISMPTPAAARTTSTAVLTIKVPSANKSDWLLPSNTALSNSFRRPFQLGGKRPSENWKRQRNLFQTQ